MAGKQDASAQGGPSKTEPKAEGAAGSSAKQEQAKEQPQAAPVDTSRWVIVYPAYLDARKTEAEGRRVRKDIAVKAPHAVEIFKICGELGITAKLELNKTYSRDFFSRGRVRIKLFEDNTKTPLLKQIPNRKSLLVHLAVAFKDFRERNGSLEKHADPMLMVSLGVTKTSADTKSSDKKKGKKR